jgi:hypothetical protein
MTKRDRGWKIGVARTLGSLSVVLAALGCAAVPEETEIDGHEPTGERDDEVGSGSVEQAMKEFCSTSSILPLSIQIIEEAQCLEPEAYVELPERPNLVVQANVFPFLEKPANDALVDALDANPSKTLNAISMLRTVAQQYMIYRWYQTGRCGIKLAAKPGNSNHETGLAIDLSPSSTWRTPLVKRGFKWIGSKDPNHYDYVGNGAVSYKGLDIEAFQRLWNRNHPEDIIEEDGLWGPQSQGRMQKAPAAGFAKGAFCHEPESDEIEDG